MVAILFVTRNEDTFTNPTLMFLFKKLLEKGYLPVLMAPPQLVEVPNCLRGIKLYLVPPMYSRFQIRLHAFLLVLWSYIDSVNGIPGFRDEPVKMIIGIDPIGLVTANKISKIFKTPPLGYFSFEIFFKDELQNKVDYWLKKAEIEASQQLSFCVVQDEYREKSLIRENRINSDCKLFRIPVSPEKYIYDTRNNSDCEETCKIIFSGKLDRYNGVDNILDVVEKDWDNDFSIEFHSKFKLKKSDKYNKRIAYLNKKGLPVTLHHGPFTNQSEYFEYLCKFDIGIAFYIPMPSSTYYGKNIDQIGLSSGKFSAYMMLGLPTITTYHQAFSELNKKYQFGKVLNNVSELPGALNEIRNNYKQCQKGCLELYDSVLNPQSSIDKLLAFIDTTI